MKNRIKIAARNRLRDGLPFGQVRTINLEVDPKSHPAWTGVHRLLDSGGQLAKFNKRFKGMGLKGS